jgi:hypothetical protein
MSCKHDWLEKPDYGERYCAKCQKVEHMPPIEKFTGKSKNGWHEVEMAPNKLLTVGTTAWRKEHLLLLFSPLEQHATGQLWAHASISHPKRYPNWDEILDARYTFFTETDEVVQVLPKKDEYVNLHKNCFHLWSPCGGKRIVAE